MSGVVYEILYTNGKRYIGKDTRWPLRKKQHIYQSKQDTPNLLCEKKMKQHGWITIKPLVSLATEDELKRTEQVFISLFLTNTRPTRKISAGI